MSDLIQKAMNYVRAHHALQVRKWTKAPYFTHLHEVAMLVASVSTDERLIAAAYLHDVIEDTPVTYRDVLEQFGVDVADLVLSVTNPSRHDMGKREVRVAIDRQYLAGAPIGGKTIKLADMISNCSDVVDHDIDFAKTYLAEKERLLTVLMNGNDTLWNRAWATVKAQNKRLQARLADAG
jgi:(p)ppGpp synthase/HD superfamily hydrolase